VRTDESGNATVEIPAPSDQLGSTYGVHVASNGATADTRVSVPTAQAAIRLTVDRAEQSIGTPLAFNVYAESLDGKPLAGAAVTIEMTHGASGAQQRLTLDSDGHARGSFSSPDLGTNFLRAWVDRGGRAMDAAQVRVDPQVASSTSDGRSSNVQVTLGRDTYAADDEITVEADAPGSRGDALITFESAAGVQSQVVRSSGGRAVARVSALDAAGELRVGAAFVRDGVLEWNTVPIALAAPGRPRVEQLAMGTGEFAPGQAAKVSFRGTSFGAGTFIVRIAQGTPSGSALFASAPALLEIGATSTQNSAPESTTWHSWVNSTGDHAQVLGFVRHTQPPPELSLAEADTQTISWEVARANDGGVAIALPARSGRYDLSVLGIADDGSVTAASCAVVVR
jgi:hypothetical protein